MKNFIVTSLFIFAVGALNAQVEPWCGTDQYNESIFAANPDLRLQMISGIVWCGQLVDLQKVYANCCAEALFGSSMDHGPLWALRAWY